ncbi:MAG: PHP domain-containing protein [Clostridia bacterium]|nr:PHP domain-containing protein [Clostridia bacterium]
MERVELHLHTKLSDDVSVIEPAEAIERALAWQHTAVAFTNLNNVQDFPAIAEAASKAPSLRVIYGAELRYAADNGIAPYGITALVKNRAGLKELYTVLSSLKDDGVCELIDTAVLKKHRKNLLIGSCGELSELFALIARGADREVIERAAAFYDYFEIYPTDDAEEQRVYAAIFRLGEQLGVPVAAVGNCHYLDRRDELCRRVMRTVKGHTDKNTRLFFHSTKEMLAAFAYLGEREAYQAVVSDPHTIAACVEAVSPLWENRCTPVVENAGEQLCSLAHAQANALYGSPLPAPVAERLEEELGHIQRHGFAVPYLVAYELARAMHHEGVRTGTRGSLGSVLTAFFLGITDSNPLPPHYRCAQGHYAEFADAFDGAELPAKPCPVCGSRLIADGHNIPYETFMGYDGSAVPDLSLNFPVAKRTRALEQLKTQFSEEQLAHAGCITTLWERFAEGYIAVYEAETADYLSNKQRDRVCRKLCGVKRNVVTHPSAVLVMPAERNFTELTPLRAAERDTPIPSVTQLDHHSLRNSLMRVDVLGHTTLDLLMALEAATGCSADTVPWDDPEVYALFESADTLGIPEFDSEFMRELLAKTNPHSFSELVQLSGLSHGTGTWRNNGEVLLNEGHTLHELPALRDDVFLQLLHYGFNKRTAYYLMRYVRMGKLSRATSDNIPRVLRRAGVPDWYVQSLKKIQYQFPKAHAVAYVKNAVRTAWFKRYHPAAFYAACVATYFPAEKVLTDEENTHRQSLLKECAAKGLPLPE